MGYAFSPFGEEAMPWKECSVMDERLQFVARRLAGEPMAELCREFGISRKTGYKIFDRYQECGVQGLTDRSRRPYRYAHQLPFQVENYILNVKREHASWGARKIRERLIRRFSGIKIPAKSTIHALLDRHGLVARRGRLRRRAQGTPLSLGQRPNELWCTDYKGEFLLGNRQYCYPLTVTDHASRFSSPVRLFLLPGKTMLSPCLKGFFESAVFRPTSAAITVFPSLPLTLYSI
jgi:transposase